MRTILLGILFLSAISHADPFSSSPLRLEVTRQSIHDSKAVRIAATPKPVVVRYNLKDYSSCFILSVSGDIPCHLQEGLIGVITPHGEIYPLEVVVSANDFMNLIGDLKWTDSLLKQEFSGFAAAGKLYPQAFYFSDYDYDKPEPKGSLNIGSLEITSPDGKVVYTVQ